jgi:hypothetical protein
MRQMPRKRRLSSLIELRRFLADVINRLHRDEIEPNKASKLGYLCQIQSRLIEGGDLERRVAVLEKLIEKKN